LRPGLIGLGLELGVPPLSLLVAIWAVLLTVCVLWWQLRDGSWAPALTLASAALLAGLAVLAAWAKFGRRMLPLGTLLTAPFYVAWKLPIYAKMLFAREKSWVRTERDGLKRL
jgi:hypothetical protein